MSCVGKAGSCVTPEKKHIRLVIGKFFIPDKRCNSPGYGSQIRCLANAQIGSPGLAATRKDYRRNIFTTPWATNVHQYGTCLIYLTRAGGKIFGGGGKLFSRSRQTEFDAQRSGQSPQCSFELV